MFTLQCPGSASAPVHILALRFFPLPDAAGGQPLPPQQPTRHKILTHRIHLLARIAHERDSVKAANRMEHIQLHQCPHRADGHQIRCTNKHIHSVCIREGQLPRFFSLKSPYSMVNSSASSSASFFIPAIRSPVTKDFLSPAI